jgi:hypothetical protein
LSAHIAVVGAGWAGLAAAVHLTGQGQRVTLLEMAAQAGGRARGVERDGATFDNGQHILIGAYDETLALMRCVGADPDLLLHRQPLTLVRPGTHGLRLPPGPALPAFVRAVLANRDWTLSERLALLRTAAAWAVRRFRCDPGLTVQALCAGLPARLRDDLIDPLCVAALNTPAAEASASVLLRVLRDALFSGPGAADLLLPRVTLDHLLPRRHWPGWPHGAPNCGSVIGCKPCKGCAAACLAGRLTAKPSTPPCWPARPQKPPAWPPTSMPIGRAAQQPCATNRSSRSLSTPTVHGWPNR